jgi:hypothetical protein
MLINVFMSHMLPQYMWLNKKSLGINLKEAENIYCFHRFKIIPKVNRSPRFGTHP